MGTGNESKRYSVQSLLCFRRVCVSPIDIKIAIPLKENGLSEDSTQQLDPQHERF